METILFKIILSSVVLIGFYYLFLEKERIFKFNRSYLLIALVFSYIVPFIPIKNPWPIVAKSNLIVGEAVQDFQIGTITRTENVDWMSVLLIGYLLVSGFFLIKFFYSIFKIKFLKGEPINYRNQKIVIIDKEFAML
jgi:bla regulator protein BlaR1